MKSLISSLEQQYKDVMNVELCLSDVTLLNYDPILDRFNSLR